MSTLTAAEIQALLERVAALERQAVLTAPAPVNTYVPPEWTPKVYTTVSVASLWGIDLPNDLRDFWQVCAAVALARGERVLIGSEIAKEYAPLMRRVYAGRKKRLSWRAALEAAGLTPPDDARVAELALELHAEATSGALWDGLLPAASAVKDRAVGIKASETLGALRGLMI